MASIRMEYTGFGKLQTRTILSAEINGVVTHWVESDYEYDGLGRIIRETNAGLSSFSKYDVLGRLIETGRSSGSGEEEIASYTYAIETIGSQMVWKTSVVDANDKMSYSYANVKGQVIKTSPPIGPGPSVLFTYDVLGRLTQTTYGNATTTIQYNPAGLKTQIVDPDMGTWNYTYDAQGNLKTQTSAGITTTLTYDGLNRVLSKTYSNDSPSVTYSYDANGDVGYRTGMSDETGATTWDYDARGRLIREMKTVSGRSFITLYTYNSADQVTFMAYPNNEVLKITHLPQGGNDTVGSYLTGTQVDSNGRVSTRTFGNGTTTDMQYHDWLTEGGRLSTLKSGQQGSLLDLRFAYDNVGNIQTITDVLNSNQIQSFTYDSLNRLTSASTNAIGIGQYTPQSYTYNTTTGNLSNKSDVGAYTYSTAQPHAVTQAGTNSYAYDPNGRMTSRTVAGVTWTYAYDADGQLTHIKKNNQLVSEYGYDGDGNRVWAKDYEGYSAGEFKETIYIGNYYEFVTEVLTPEPGEGCACMGYYCTYLPLLFKSPRGISYYYADGQRIAMKDNEGEVSYLYGDQLGSVSVVADSSGNLVSRTYYEPWGEIRDTEGTSPTDYAYTGQKQEGDIYFYNARWYDPQLGRFMQADTIVPIAQGTQAFDRYAYVNNNPMRYTDPSGNYFKECGDDDYGRCGTIPPAPTYNIFVCGIGDGINCGGTDIQSPLNPYNTWSGQNVYYDVDSYGNKANTAAEVWNYISSLSRRSRIRLIGHSAGADTILLVLEILFNSSNNLDVTGVVLLDTSLSGGQYKNVGDMMQIVDDLLGSGMPSYFVTTTDYPNDSDTKYTWQFLPVTDEKKFPNYYYYDLRNDINYDDLLHKDLALDVDIADKIWSWIKGK